MTGDFTQITRWDNGDWRPLAPNPDGNYSFIPQTGLGGYGGIIASTADGSYAMGIYGVLTGNGGSVSYFGAQNFLSNSSPTMKLTAVYDDQASMNTMQQPIFTPGTPSHYYFSTWVISGSATSVVNTMNALHSQQAVGPIQRGPGL